MDPLIRPDEYLRELANRIVRSQTQRDFDSFDVDRLRTIATEIVKLSARPVAPPTFEEILDEAHAAAKVTIAKLGPENPNALDCGFAWVCLPGNASFARRCSNAAKKATDNDPARYGRKMASTGWTFWNPGGFSGQAIGHHEAGARAFRDVLAKHGIRADLGSRYD